MLTIARLAALSTQTSEKQSKSILFLLIGKTVVKQFEEIYNSWE